MVQVLRRFVFLRSALNPLSHFFVPAEAFQPEDFCVWSGGLPSNYGAVRETRDAEARRFATKLGVAVKS
jgi:hypothetical protein